MLVVLTGGKGPYICRVYLLIGIIMRTALLNAQLWAADLGMDILLVQFTVFSWVICSALVLVRGMGSIMHLCDSVWWYVISETPRKAIACPFVVVPTTP